MNKRFSTLLAAALVAGGFSFNAMAAPYQPTTVTGGVIKDGGKLYLKAGSNFLTVGDNGALATTVTTIDGTNLASAIWTVKAIAQSTAAGNNYAYQFVNKGTGQILSVELKTNAVSGNKGEKKNVKIEAGNSTWAWDDANGLYAVKGDSVFYFDGTTLYSEKATTPSATPTTPILNGAIVATDNFEMKAADFKALVAGGKLYFKGENVSTGQTNVLTANNWTAESYNIASGAFAAVGVDDVNANALFLTNGQKVAGYDNAKAATTSKKKYLLVDHKYYDAPANTLNILAVDTLSFDPTAAASATTVIDARTKKVGKHHPFAAAFKAEYFIANDSIVLTSLYQPASIDVTTTLTELAGQTYTTLTTVTSLGTAVKSFYEGAASGKPADDATFAAAKFDGSFAYATAGTKTGAELIAAAQKQITDAKDAEGATDAQKKALAAEKTAANALIAGIKGLKVVTATAGAGTPAVVTTDKYVADKNFEDGLTSLVTTAQTDKQIIVRKLSDTKVVTIAAKADASNLIALIQPEIAGMGGDAVIAEGIYYVKDMRKVDETDDSKVNLGYGLYYDYSPVNGTEYVAKAQTFNPYAQFVVIKSAGVEKGNYTIANRATDNKWFGVTSKVAGAENVYVIGGDTIQLEAATGVSKADKKIGYKYISDADAKNNKFTITSAAEMLAGQGINMVADSTLKIADVVNQYSLVPSPDAKMTIAGVDTLVYRTYTIMDVDSAFIVRNALGNYAFSHKSSGITPARFFMTAVDTDSTYVLYDAIQVLGSWDYKKMVISTQYKTISASALSERNDLFLVKQEAAPASYKTTPKHVRIQAANGDFAAVNSKNQAVAVRENDELKAAYSNLDFIFWLDTAAYDNADIYKYYITKGVKAAGEVAASRLYMWNSKDSAAVKDANKELPYMAGTANRVMFRTASVMAKDTLLVPTLAGTAKIDTVATAAGTSVDGLKHKVKAGVNNFQFSFEFASKDAKNEYNIVTDGSYVHSQNGVLVMGDKKDALVVNVLDVDAKDVIATDNETIEASSVSVIASEGQITIAGAEGKKMVISNILGQAIANTVISSSNATIAVPAGVVVVAIEGEAAVKAIVK